MSRYLCVLFAAGALASGVVPARCETAVFGEVRDAGGAAVAGARVTVAGQEVVTDGEGRYRTADLNPGRHEVIVRAANFLPGKRAVELGTTGVRADFRLVIAPLRQAITVSALEDLEGKAARDPYRDALDMREVRESAARDAGEALSKLDGVWMLRKGAIANDVVLRGMQYNNLNVLIDGARIYGACPGHMDPPASHVDFAEVERIEVTKGAFDITSQGSLGGSVNIVRKRPGPGFHVTPGLALGSFGYRNPSLRASYSREAFDVSAGYSFRRSDPYVDGSGRLMTAVGGYNPAFQRDTAFAAHSGWSSVRVKGLELSYTHQDSSNVLYPYLLMDSPYDRADRLDAKYRWNKVRVQSYYSIVRHWMTDEKRNSALGALDVFSMASFAASRVAGVRVESALRGGFTAGVEAYQRNWDVVNSMRSRMSQMDSNIIPNVNTTVVGAYLDWHRSVTDKLRVGAGARVDTAHMYVRNEGVPLTPNSRRDTNPSGNVRVIYTLRDGAELFAGVGSTVRLPDGQERFLYQRRMAGDRMGNPLLEPSRNTEFNVGANLRRGGMFVKPVMFHSNLRDFVVMHQRLQPTPARSFANVDARLYGYEVSYGAPFGTYFLLAGGASYTRSSKDVRPDLNIASSSVPEIPPFRGRTSLRYTRSLWFAEAECVAVGRQDRVDTDLGEWRTPGYALANVRTGVRFRHISVNLSVENLLDRFHYQHLSYMRDLFRSGARLAEPGRSIFVHVLYAF